MYFNNCTSNITMQQRTRGQICLRGGGFDLGGFWPRGGFVRGGVMSGYPAIPQWHTPVFCYFTVRYSKWAWQNSGCGRSDRFY